MYYSLFTPYGYKFEGKVESGWRAGMINEDYGNTDVNQPTNKPWNHAKIGAINPEDRLSTLGSQGYYWGNIGYMTSGQAHGFYFDNRNLFPANYSGRQSGLSVCRVEIIKSLFTPYGYKFENKSKLGIHEVYTSNMLRKLDQKPWRFGKSGYIDLHTEENRIYGIGDGGVFWIDTSVDIHTAVRLSFSYQSLYPTVYDSKSWGNSVHCV